MGPDLGPWDPLSPAEVARRFSAAVAPPARPLTWWLCGGEALDLFVGHRTRAHEDIDVSILRTEVARLRPRLPGWDLHLAHAGTLTPWDGRPIEEPCNSLWCRRRLGEPWRLQIMLEDGTRERWVCRRFPELTVPLDRLIRWSNEGIPHVIPEVQLLMKAKDHRPKDDIDFDLVLPLLSPAAADWLHAALRAYHPGHPWLDVRAWKRPGPVQRFSPDASA